MSKLIEPVITTRRSFHVAPPRNDGRRTAGNLRALVEALDQARVPDGAWLVHSPDNGYTLEWVVE